MVGKMGRWEPDPFSGRTPQVNKSHGRTLARGRC